MTEKIGRRSLVKGMAGLAGVCSLPGMLFADNHYKVSTRRIKSSGLNIPVIGLGSWLTFDAGAARSRRENVQQIMRAFFEHGGRMIDSSPMYSTAQEVIGSGLRQLENADSLFSATKVWIPGRSPGVWQMEGALELWGLKSFDLIYVHNLLDWDTHLPWLRNWQSEGRVRHIGVTTSHGRRHDDLVDVMNTEKLDFVQFTYNIFDREAEQRLLPVAADNGLSVVINRPLKGGALFRRVRGKPLPDWASEIAVENWAQYFLKFIVSHPAVTCAIPATSRIDHLHENMGALRGPMPDAAMRAEMIRYFTRVST